MTHDLTFVKHQFHLTDEGIALLLDRSGGGVRTLSAATAVDDDGFLRVTGVDEAGVGRVWRVDDQGCGCGSSVRVHESVPEEVLT